MLGMKHSGPAKSQNMPAPTRPQAQPQLPPAKPMQQLHPAAQEAAMVFSETMADNDRLRGEVMKLRNELEVEKRACRELEHQLDRETQRREFFEHWATELDCQLGNISSAITSARQRGNEIARQRGQHKPMPDDPHDGAAEMARKFAPDPNGAHGNLAQPPVDGTKVS